MAQGENGEKLCWTQETCEDYSAGHKRRSHGVRVSTPCIRIESGTCPLLGKVCNIEKVKKAKESMMKVWPK